MAKLFRVLFVGLFLSQFALGACENGVQIAQQAVIEHLAKGSPNSKYLCTAYSGAPESLPNSQELYHVQASCKSSIGEQISLFRVTLQEAEDSICFVKKVVRYGANG